MTQADASEVRRADNPQRVGALFLRVTTAFTQDRYAAADGKFGILRAV
jgi:hypothetical protein